MGGEGKLTGGEVSGGGYVLHSYTLATHSVVRRSVAAVNQQSEDDRRDCHCA